MKALENRPPPDFLGERTDGRVYLSDRKKNNQLHEKSAVCQTYGRRKQPLSTGRRGVWFDENSC